MDKKKEYTGQEKVKGDGEGRRGQEKNSEGENESRLPEEGKEIQKRKELTYMIHETRKMRHEKGKTQRGGQEWKESTEEVDRGGRQGQRGEANEGL